MRLVSGAAWVWLPLAISLLLFATGPAQAGEKYAFLVAVKSYRKSELKSLRYTENDVSALAEVLKRTGYAEENIVLMTQGQGAVEARYAPFAENIRRELRLLLKELKPDDLVLVAFSGHGVQFANEEGAYFCPADAKLTDRNTLVSLAEVYQSLADCHAGTRVLLVDACRNDPQSDINKAAGSVELEAVGRPQAVTPPKGIMALFSCSEGEKSYELPELEHGVFFNYVIEGLSGQADLNPDGEITVTELEEYTVQKVQRRVRRDVGESQTPARKGEAQGRLVLANVAGDDTPPATTSSRPRPARPATVEPGPAAPPKPFDGKFEGTTWLVTDSEGDEYTVSFQPGGKLEYVFNGVRRTNGSWSIQGGQITWETNNKFTMFNGQISGNTLSGKAVSTNGPQGKTRAWTWEARLK